MKYLMLAYSCFLAIADVSVNSQFNYEQMQNQNISQNGVQTGGYGGSSSMLVPNGQTQVEMLALYERDPVLLLINRLRRHLAKARVNGTNDNENFSNFQGAQRMYKLVWDMLLEDKARYLAAFCQKITQSNDYQNVHMSSTRATRKNLLLESAKKWWSEVFLIQKMMNMNTPIPFSDIQEIQQTNLTNHASIQNWKNMAASFMTRMGCAVNTCGRNGNSINSMVVCVFAHDIMNVPETLVFTPGKGCLHDADCSTYTSSTCKSAFCIYEQNQLPQEVEEEFRGDILYEMNKRRRKLAHGTLIENAPRVKTASNMYKLEWAADLEERAQRISLQCQNAVFDTMTNPDLGHSVYVDTGVTREEDFKRRGNILEQAIHAWWYSVDQNILQNQCPQGQEMQCYAYMKNFVNIAYYRATEVGCAVNHDCENHTAVVCFFRKGGQDIRGHPIYPPGRPCLQDKECTEYGDSLCETHTGLCVDVAKGKARRYVQSIRRGLKRGIVSRLNSIRQRVIARLGEINDGPCHPTGNNFYKLRWNEKLEKRALEISSWCRKERRIRYKYIGENYFVSHDMDTHGDPRKLLKRAISKWMHESKNNAVSHLDASEKRDKCINYNNMLYGGYVNVACAINHCNDEIHRFSLVVCLFQRSPSVADSDLKVPFKKSCLNKTCTSYPNSTCEQNSGLCKINQHGQNMFLNNNTFNTNGVYGVMPASTYPNNNFVVGNQPNYSTLYPNTGNSVYNNGQPMNFGVQFPVNGQYNYPNRQTMSPADQSYNQTLNNKKNKFGRRHKKKYSNYNNHFDSNAIRAQDANDNILEGDVEDGTNDIN